MSKNPSQSIGDQLKPYVAPFRFDGSGAFHLRSHKTMREGGLDRDKAGNTRANRIRLPISRSGFTPRTTGQCS